MDIEKLALEFIGAESLIEKLNDDSLNKTAGPKRKRNRAAIVKQYDRYVKRYSKEKAIVDAIMKEAMELRKKYDKHQSELNHYQKTMLELRSVLHELDDSGKEFIEISLPDDDVLTNNDKKSDDNNRSNYYPSYNY